MNSSKCEHVRQLARQVRQRHMIHRQPDQRMQEVEECSFDLIECHGCTILVSMHVLYCTCRVGGISTRMKCHIVYRQH